MSKFYTRKGDDGTAGQLGKDRVPKDHPRTEAIGAIDEANATIGMVRAICLVPHAQDIIMAVQRDLYNLMAEISATPDNAERFRFITADRVTWIEEQIEVLSSGIEMPREFVLPGDSLAGAVIDLARTTVRRAERRVTSLWRTGDLENPELLRYLNRLSSLCFVLEIAEIKSGGMESPTLANESKTPEK